MTGIVTIIIMSVILWVVWSLANLDKPVKFG